MQVLEITEWQIYLDILNIYVLTLENKGEIDFFLSLFYLLLCIVKTKRRKVFWNIVFPIKIIDDAILLHFYFWSEVNLDLVILLNVIGLTCPILKTALKYIWNDGARYRTLLRPILLLCLIFLWHFKVTYSLCICLCVESLLV